MDFHQIRQRITERCLREFLIDVECRIRERQLYFKIRNIFLIIASYEKKSITEAIDMVKESVKVMNGFERSIRDDFAVPKALNGTHGFVSSKSQQSLELTVWSLQRLQELLHEHNYTSTNLLSMMTLNVEHFHSTTHVKQVMLSPLQYAISFMTSVKESLKRNFPWGTYYFTSTKGSWYPPSENSLDFMKVKKLLPSKKYSRAGARNKVQEEEMRQWALTYTRGVRQRSVRQETTMDKSGTLPHYLYSVDIAKQAEQNKKFGETSEETPATPQQHSQLEQSDPDNESHETAANPQHDQLSEESSDEFSCDEDTNENETIETPDGTDLAEQAFWLGGCISFSEIGDSFV